MSQKLNSLGAVPKACMVQKTRNEQTLGELRDMQRKGLMGWEKLGARNEEG